MDWNALIGELTNALRHLGIAEPEVRIREVNSIARQATGKLKRFVPLTDTAAS